MKTTRLWVLLALLGLAGAVAGAQEHDDDYYEDEPDKPRHETGDQAPMLFITPTIIDRAIDRITDELARHYDFDDDQLWETREVIKERFPRFILENRAEIITVVNQWVEAVIGAEPPTPEEVADWAERAQPLLNDVFDLMEESSDELRTFMTEEQQLQLDGEMAMFRVGVNHMNHRMDVWADGGYDWETEWPRSEAFRQKEREREGQLRREQEQARREALGLESVPEAEGAGASVEPESPTTKPAVPSPSRLKDEWTEYVNKFIKRYRLNEDQQENAWRALRGQQETRDNYLRRRLPDIEALEKRGEKVTTEEERDKIRAELEKLNKALERYFQQLKDKLDRIPTRRQRAAAAKAEMEAREKAEQPEKKESTKND